MSTGGLRPEGREECTARWKDWGALVCPGDPMAAWRVLTLLLAELRGLHPREEVGDGAGVPGGVREETGWEYIRPLGQGEGREEEEEVDGEWRHGDDSPETGGEEGGRELYAGR